MKPMLPLPGLLLAGGLALAPALAMAQDSTPPPPANPEIAEGAEKLSEGFRLLFQGLMIEGKEGWEKLGEWLSDLNAYEAPERLPNGDILIRRKAPLEAGETEL